jgi:ubiquinone/menaquinone biosynthesis C-methylase UbiE
VLPFADASFDAVVNCVSIDYLVRPVTVLREVARVLRPGGLFVHETRVAQLLAHPVRSLGRRLPWHEVPALGRGRSAVLWAARERR